MPNKDAWSTKPHTLLNMKTREVGRRALHKQVIRLMGERSQMGAANVLDKFWGSIALSILQSTPTQSVELE